MDVTQRGQLSREDWLRLLAAEAEYGEARAAYQGLCVEMVAKSSYREVAHHTGLSTTTLQRWVKEARS